MPHKDEFCLVIVNDDASKNSDDLECRLGGRGCPCSTGGTEFNLEVVT